MKKARKQNTQKKKPHWPIMGFIKEKINSWYLMHPAPNLNGCSLVFLFPFKNTEYLNCGIDAFVLPSATLREVAERCLLEEVCISHLDRKLLFPAQHPTGAQPPTPSAAGICFAQTFPPAHLSISTSYLVRLPIRIFTVCPNKMGFPSLYNFLINVLLSCLNRKALKQTSLICFIELV